MNPGVVVIGGGAIGASCAFELAQRGLDVTLLEQGAELAAGCSSGNAGLICPSHSAPLANPAALRQGMRWMFEPDSPLYLRPRLGVVPWLVRFTVSCRPEQAEAGERAIREISVASLTLHAELAGAGHQTGFTRRGSLSVFETQSGFAAAMMEVGHNGLPASVLSLEEARELEPSLGDGIVGAVLYPDEAHCEPAGYVHAMGRAASAAGAEIRTGVEVRSLSRRNGRIALETSEGPISPETVVLAAGAQTARLARQAGVFVPLEGGKGYHVDLEPLPGDPRIPVFMQEARALATPLAGRLRLAGTLELAGLDLSINKRRVDAIRRAAARVLHDHGERRVLEVWAGLRPCTPDGLPVIGHPPGDDRLVIATGHAMKGLSLAPITARLVGQLVASGEPDFDLAPFRPERFRAMIGL